MLKRSLAPYEINHPESGLETMSDHNCDTTLDVRGFHNVLEMISAVTSRDSGTTEKYLLVNKAVIKDNGEAEIREPAALSLHLFGGAKLDSILHEITLFGPIWHGYNDQGHDKWEWEDYCTVKYSNFCVADLSGYLHESIRFIVSEGDHGGTWWAPLLRPLVELFAPSALTDDIVFDVTVRIDDLLAHDEVTLVGDCDLRGECAELTVAFKELQNDALHSK